MTNQRFNNKIMTAQAVIQHLKANGFQHVYETTNDEVIVGEFDPHFCTIKKDTNGTWKPKVTAIVLSAWGWVAFIAVFLATRIILYILNIEGNLAVYIAMQVLAVWAMNLVNYQRKKAKQTEMEQKLLEIITVDGGR
jgi:hypothetical protein